MLMIVLIAALDTPDPAIITKPGTGEIGLIKNLGTKLFTDYVVPFEISSYFVFECNGGCSSD
jgi:hypothetical protein